MIREPDLFISSGATDKEAAEYLNTLFYDAARECATDIHFQFVETKCRIRFRVSGVMVDIDTVEPQMAKHIDEKIRSRSHMSQAERHAPLDGRMRLRFSDRAIDVRVALIPSVGGQLCVCRLLDQANACRSLDSIELATPVRHCIDELIEEPHGLLYVCGPTGSGKTTTLYAILAALNNGDRNIVTIENPVEYTVPGITQINIDQHITFAGALRSVLRLDPDVILVGEIRDAETAKIAVQAANTGHLVLSTLHANNSALGITRMLDFGVDVQSLASALRGVIAQRLVQRISKDSERLWSPPSEADIAWLSMHGLDNTYAQLAHVHSHSDYEGMVPVIEMIRADARVREAIISQRGEVEVFNAAMRQMQFETLARAGVRLAASGVTTIDHVKKVVGQDAIVLKTRRLGQILVDQGIVTQEQIDELVTIQSEKRRQGLLVHIGGLLLDGGYCTAEQLAEAIGMTDDAVRSANVLIENDKITQSELDVAAEEWRAGNQRKSLFRIIVENGLVAKENLDEASLVHCTGHCGNCRANCKRSGKNGEAAISNSEETV